MKKWKLSEETRRKMSSIRKGRKLTDNWKKHISEGQKGRIPWNKGKTNIFSKESIEKMSNSHKGEKSAYWKNKTHTEEYKKKMSDKLKGRKLTIEWKNNISKGNKGVHRKTYWKGRRHKEESLKKIRHSRAKQIFPIQDTKPEIIMQKFLKRIKVDFIPHYYINDIEHSYQCDLFIPSKKIIIECDGDYWHGNPDKYLISDKHLKQHSIDALRTKELEEKGYKVIRLWEHEILANKDIYEGISVK